MVWENYFPPDLQKLDEYNVLLISQGCFSGASCY